MLHYIFGYTETSGPNPGFVNLQEDDSDPAIVLRVKGGGEYGVSEIILCEADLMNLERALLVRRVGEERAKAYAALDSEREYQDRQIGNARRHADQPPMTPGEIILCATKCLNDARDAWYAPAGGVNCLPFLRKVGALTVQCMERFGAPVRENP